MAAKKRRLLGEGRELGGDDGSGSLSCLPPCSGAKGLGVWAKILLRLPGLGRAQPRGVDMVLSPPRIRTFWIGFVLSLATILVLTVTDNPLTGAFWSDPLSAKPTPSAPPALSVNRYPSPSDIALVPGTDFALVCNQGTDTVTLVDVAKGSKVASLPTGRRPSGVAVSGDGKRAVVANLWDDSVSLFEIKNQTLTSSGAFAVGHMPRGISFVPGTDRFVVALAGDNEIALASFMDKRILAKKAVAQEPRRILIDGSGKNILVGSGRSATVTRLSLVDLKTVWVAPFSSAFNMVGLAFGPGEKEIITCQAYDRHHSIAKHNIEQGWAIDNRLGRLKLDGRIETTSGAPELAEQEQLSVDMRGQASGDLGAVFVSVDGKWMAVCGSGTQELFVLPGDLPWSAGDPGDFIDVNLEYPERKFRKIALGGRPVAVAIRQTSKGSVAIVANQLLDCVQVIDLASGKILRSIPLYEGKETAGDSARRGEAIFYDARRSHHQWFSCHTCHPDGHTSGRTFDTLADESFGNAKMTPTLRGVEATAPWGWHGAKDNLAKSVEDSLNETLYSTKKPSADEVRDLVNFLKTLDHPKNPKQATEASRRGEEIFRAKANCIRCHQGKSFTTPKSYEVGLEADGSPFEFWNPPSLRGVFDRNPLGHEGKAGTIFEFLRLYHPPEKLGGKAISDAERMDLVEYLKGL